MATHNLQIGQDYRKLQEEVNTILEEVHHLFDSFAEYSHETDPANVIDLDQVLTVQKVHANDAATTHKHSIHKHIVNHKQFPKNPAKVVNAMPAELQEEVKIYESELSSNQQQQKSLLKYLFKRLEF